MRPLIVGAISLLLIASSAGAQTPDTPPDWLSPRPHHNLWDITWQSPPGNPPPAVRLQSMAFPPALLPALGDAAQPLHAAAVEHSDGYVLRRKIHKYASFATLPLFATEIALGQSLYDGNGGSARGAHAAVGAGIAGLFAVNTVTGAWNLFGEGRKDSKGRTLRLVHGLLMMAADVGILATTMSAPKSDGGPGSSSFQDGRVTHRNLAIASISTATAGYLLMLFGGR